MILSPMFWLGLYATVAQRLILGDPGTVTRDDLGHLGGDPHFTPPPRDYLAEVKQGFDPERRQ